MRLFVAIEMSEPIRRALEQAIDQLRSSRTPVKWVEPQNIHLTLKFLGEVPEARLERARQIVRDCAASAVPFDLIVKGAGAFPDMRRPRVVWAGACDQPPVAAALAAQLNERMEEIGVEREERPFQNHVTLGRMREPRPAPELTEALKAFAQREFGMMRVEQITLMRSDLRREGPLYTPIERAPLGPTGR